MKLFPHLYYKSVKNDYALFHPLTMEVVYVSGAVSKEQLKDMMAANCEFQDWFVDDAFRYNDFIDDMLKENDYRKIDFKTLKMFITTECNLNCDYCLIEKNVEKRNSGKEHISYNVGQRIIDNFSKLCLNQKTSNKTIMLYGGEPLLNWENLLNIILYIRKLEDENKFNGEVEIILETNGTLVDSEKAEFLKRTNVTVIVSIDGNENVHNHYRKYCNAKGTYHDALQGYRTLVDRGCNTVISSVYTDAYASDVESCIKNTVESIRPRSMGLNLFHVLEDQEIQNDQTDLLYGQYINAFELASKNGLYIEHIMRRIRPLVDQKIRIKDCGACGNRIVSDCQGRIGICEGLIGNGQYFLDRENILELYQDDVFKEWAKRTPFKMGECQGCCAIALCGGGCVNNAIFQNNNVFAPDRYICNSSKAFVNWAIDTWYERNNLFDLLDGENIHRLTKDERRSILGCLQDFDDLPLQTISKQYEINAKG